MRIVQKDRLLLRIAQKHRLCPSEKGPEMSIFSHPFHAGKRRCFPGKNCSFYSREKETFIVQKIEQKRFQETSSFGRPFWVPFSSCKCTAKHNLFQNIFRYIFPLEKVATGEVVTATHDHKTEASITHDLKERTQSGPASSKFWGDNFQERISLLLKIWPPFVCTSLVRSLHTTIAGDVY